MRAGNWLLGGDYGSLSGGGKYRLEFGGGWASIRLNKAYWRYIENELYNYDDTKEMIINLREDIISQAPLKEAISGAGYISDPTASKATKLISNKAIARMTHVIKAIDRSLSRLTENHRALFELKYRQALSWQQVCREMPTSERSYFRMRRELVCMVAVELGMAETWQE